MNIYIRIFFIILILAAFYLTNFNDNNKWFKVTGYFLLSISIIIPYYLFKKQKDNS